MKLFKRWEVVRTVHGREVVLARYMLRASAEYFKDTLEGRVPGVSLAYAPGIISIRRAA